MTKTPLSIRDLKLRSRLKTIGAVGLDQLLPPLCPLTKQPVVTPGLLSGDGWASLQFIDSPFCKTCGRPFRIDYGARALCGQCLAEPPAYDEARAAVIYDDVSHDLLVGFKYGDHTEHTPMFASWLAHAGVEILAGDPVILPTPLHKRRLLGRRFNQAALLAQALARRKRLNVNVMALERVRYTPSQTGLSADQRKRNLSGAIRVRENQAASLVGRDVVLIDDVLTTGATLSACARALRKAGVASVRALVVARVVKEGAEAI